jgi:hypothetical protein
VKFHWIGCAAFTLVVASLASPAFAQEATPPAGEDAKTEEMSGKLESLTEQVQTLNSDVDRLKKFKFSGYVQARWETAENKVDTAGVTGSTGNNERFYIRRARLKLTYDSSPLSQGVVYIDGGADRTVRLLEAYVTLLDPWTKEHRHGLTVGQMNVPFGYELERSSSVRELPERSRAENTLFPGERDRGAKVVSQWMSRLETVVGIFNGGGVNDPLFPNTDPTQRKDWCARARVILGVFDAAVSYYDGRGVVPVAGPGDVEFVRNRLGADAQFYYQVPALGGGTLRAELYDGKNPNPASPRIATDFLGWYGMWVQNLGERLQLAARYDTYDPDVNIDHDQFERVSVGVNGFYDGFTRLTVAYDFLLTDVRRADGSYADPNDNLLTVQFQHKF